MPGRHLVISLFVLVLCMACSTGLAGALPKMRPYAGIGLVVFSQTKNAPEQDLQLQLYEEPGLMRVKTLDSSRLSGNEWVFGQLDGISPLIVSKRKGNWLRVFYDDAGREAWIDPKYKGRFQSWENFLKSHTSRLLPGLQSRYYQLQLQPDGKLLSTLMPSQTFKVLALEEGWGMVLTDQAQIGWLRWRDEDSRLLVAVDR